MDWLIYRLRFLFSIETVIAGVSVYFLHKIPALDSWITPPLEIAENLDNLAQYARQHSEMEYLRFFILILLTMVVVFGIGELIRRTLKRKSLLFSNNKNENNGADKTSGEL